MLDYVGIIEDQNFLPYSDTISESKIDVTQARKKDERESIWVHLWTIQH